MPGVSRTIRVASLQLGPITAEVGILGAVEDEDAGLVSICVHGQPEGEATPARIKRKDFCPVCDNEDKSTFLKGKVVGNGIVPIPREALEEIASGAEESKKKISLTSHPGKALTAAFPSGKSYYLAPRPGAANNYALLATVLAERPNQAFVGEFSFGGAPALYQLVVDEGILIMRQLARPESVRDRPVVDGLVNDQYLQLALQFADAICAPYDPSAYRDRRAEALAKVIESTVPVPLADAEGPVSVATTDLGAALKAALAAAGSTEPAGAPAARRPGSRTARKTAVTPAQPAPAEQAATRRAPRRTARKAS